MAALSDPRAFLSAQEKRAQQMKAMGIEETDINTKDILAGNAGEGEKTGKKGSKNKKSDEPKKGKFYNSKYLFIISVLSSQLYEISHTSQSSIPS